MAKVAAYPAEPPLGDAIELDTKSGSTFKRGALVLLDGSEDVDECGADPAAILGVAAYPGDAADFTTKMLVFKASEGQKFWMSGSSNPAKSNINQSYGVAKDGDGIWYVDLTDGGNTRVYVHDVDTDRNLFKVSVLAANRQAAP